MESCEIVYRIGADENIDGIEVHEIADVMYAFAETVEAAIKETGNEGTLSINVRPFKKGSFVTEFVLSYGATVVSLFSSPEGCTLVGILTTLGFFGMSPKSVPNVIRRVKGHINENKANGDGTYTYGMGRDAITVDEETHRIIQSPKVAKPYKTVSVGPIVKIDKSINITIQGKNEFDSHNATAGSHFNEADVASIEAYAHVAIEGVPEEQEDIVSISHNVALVPKSGPYDGGENGYTFQFADETYKKVQIHDLEFRLKLERGEVRLMNRDLLVVDMETTQSISKSGKTSTSRAITKVNRYSPYDPPEQLIIDDHADRPAG